MYRGWTLFQDWAGPWKVWVALKNDDPEQGQLVHARLDFLLDEIDEYEDE